MQTIILRFIIGGEGHNWKRTNATECYTKNKRKREKQHKVTNYKTVNSETERIKGVSSFAEHFEGEKTPSPPLQTVHPCKARVMINERISQIRKTYKMLWTCCLGVKGFNVMDQKSYLVNHGALQQLPVPLKTLHLDFDFPYANRRNLKMCGDFEI